MAANNSSSVDGTAKAALIWLCLAGIIALILFIVYSLKSSRGKKSKYDSIVPSFTLAVGGVEAMENLLKYWFWCIAGLWEVSKLGCLICTTQISKGSIPQYSLE